jgi:hypothetical protein
MEANISSRMNRLVADVLLRYATSSSTGTTGSSSVSRHGTRLMWLMIDDGCQ